jgi:hypothetical protein
MIVVTGPTDRTGEEVAATEFATGAAKAVILLAGVWHLVNDLLATLVGGPTPVGVAVWAAYTAVGVPAAIAVLRGRTASRTAVLAGAVVLLAGAAAMHAAAGPEARFSFTNWAWAAAGWFAVLLWWRRSLRGFLLFLAANAVLSFVVLIGFGDGDRLDVAMLLMVVYGTSALQLTVFAGGRALDAAVRRSARARAGTERMLAARQAAEEAHEARRDRYSAARVAAETLLLGLADGRLDVDDPAVRDRCAVAAARLRRLVTEPDDVPDQLIHDLRAAADMAERRGVAVTVEQVGAVPPMPLPVRRALADAPACAVASAHQRARITVVSVAGTVTVAVVGDGDLDTPQTARHDDVAVSVDREGAQAWVQTCWTDPSA